MSEDKGAKAPRAVIEQEGAAVADEAEAETRGAASEAAAPAAAREAAAPGGKPAGESANAGRFQDATIGFIEGVGRRAWAWADAYPHTALYGAIGFILAVLILVVGLWRTVVIAIFVGVGAVLGRARDGEGDSRGLLGRLFGGKS